MQVNSRWQNYFNRGKALRLREIIYYTAAEKYGIYFTVFPQGSWCNCFRVIFRVCYCKG
jgi:hypothetical protein